MPRATAPKLVWRMPAEWEKHERTWMAWPSSGYTLGETVEEQDEARQAWSSVANAIVNFEPVTMVVDPSAVSVAREWLDPRVEILSAPLNDAWMRDIGPTFVRSIDDGSVAAVDWVFNGWGDQTWSQFDKDSRIAKFMVESEPMLCGDFTQTPEGWVLHFPHRQDADRKVEVWRDCEVHQ